MKITILTLFPSIIEAFCKESIMKRSIEKKLIQVEIINIRDYAYNIHKRCDDEPYGGGHGMLLSPEPLAQALDACNANAIHTIFPTPSAKLFTQKDAQRLSQQKELIFICGRYEGIDQRIIDMYVNETFSIGEYVLSSGEIATLAIVDSIYRLVDGVIRKESLEEESYQNGLLEYPQYTRPANFREHTVPDILLSGNHKKIKLWRQEQSKARTKKFK